MSCHSNIISNKYHGNISSTDLEEHFNTSPSNKTVILNSTTSNNNKVRLYCIVPEGYPVATSSWRRILSNATTLTTVPVVQDDRVKIRREWLTINDPEVTDSGFYQCVANNGYYERTSRRVYLNVIPGE